MIGYINIFKFDGALFGSAIYEKEESAIETGKSTKNYIQTIKIILDIPVNKEEVSNE